jgi:hypothetical protein
MFGTSVFAIVTLLACLSTPAAAQEPNSGAITISGAFDVTNAYMFRGIPQDESGAIMWPYFDLGFSLFEGEGGVKSVGVNIGTWNSLHTGDAGLDGPTEQLWYESDFYGTLGLGFGGGTSLGITYTAYTSPNGLFSTVKELALKFAVDDSEYLGAGAFAPYALVAFELDDAGQADGGLSKGTYLELGVAPGHSWPGASVSVPVKVGLSLKDYYEGPMGDEAFGYFSVAGAVTVPFTTMPTKFGTWNFHGSIEYQRLGDRNALALGDKNQAIATAGIGFSY